MLVKRQGVNALLSMLCRLRFSRSSQSDNHVCCDLNNCTLDLLSSFIEIVLKLSVSWYTNISLCLLLVALKKYMTCPFRFCTILAFLKNGILQITRGVSGCKSGKLGFGYIIKHRN